MKYPVYDTEAADVRETKDVRNYANYYSDEIPGFFELRKPDEGGANI